MRRFLPIAILFLSAALLCAPADAQRRMRTRVVSAPPGTQVITTGPQGTTGNAPLGATTATVAGSRDSVDRLLNGDFPVPGMGFDYTHLAAVNRNQAVRALVDPITLHRLALERQIRRETPVAVAPAFPIVVNSIQVNVVPQPPVIIVQEPEPQQDFIERARYVERDTAAPRSRAEAEAPSFFYEPPQRESDELVLIRRDGSLVFAVGFVTRGERIIYITRDGHRRSLAVADLDLPATRDMNEARGTSLHLTGE